MKEDVAGNKQAQRLQQLDLASDRLTGHFPSSGKTCLATLTRLHSIEENAWRGLYFYTRD